VVEVSAVVRSISDFRPPQSWQLLVKEHWFYLKMRIRFIITRADVARSMPQRALVLALIARRQAEGEILEHALTKFLQDPRRSDQKSGSLIAATISNACKVHKRAKLRVNALVTLEGE
jgi:hypothetical protein